MLAGLPLILSSLADLTGGLATDRAVRAYGLRIGRCGIGFVSLLVARPAMIAGATVEARLVAAVLIAMAGAADSFLLGAAWGVAWTRRPERRPRRRRNQYRRPAGAFLSPIILPYLLKDQGRAEDWALPLFIAGGLYIAGAFCWLLVDPAGAARHEAGESESSGLTGSGAVPGPFLKR